MIKAKTLSVVAIVVVAFKLTAAAQSSIPVSCPTTAEVEGKTLAHDEKVDLGRRVLTHCRAFSDQARYMSLHGYFAWLIEQSAEKLEGKNIRDMRDDAQGAFKVASPDWKKEKISKTRSGVYHGEQAIRTYRFAAAEAQKMWHSRGTEPAGVSASRTPRPVPVAAARRPRLQTVPPTPSVTQERAQSFFTAPYEWVKSFLKKPSIIWDRIPVSRG